MNEAAAAVKMPVMRGAASFDCRCCGAWRVSWYDVVVVIDLDPLDWIHWVSDF
jgi:hypothetical protein